MKLNSVNNNSSKSKGMQKAVYLVCILQVFSTVSFAVMYSTLTLYMKQQLGFSATRADLIAGVFFACNFALHLLSGAIGGKLLSFRGALMSSVLFQLVGGFVLALPGLTNFYIGLTFMLMGSGTMLTSINMILGQSFAAEDKRREKAFFWSYSGMNVGFLVGFSIAGFFQLHSNFSLLFSIAAAINVVCILLIVVAGGSFKDKQTSLSLAGCNQKIYRNICGFLILLIMFPVVYFLLKHATFSSELVLGLGASMLIFLLGYTLKLDADARKKMLCFITLLVAAQSFWIIYQMAPMGLMLFAKSEVNLHLFGFRIAPAWISTISAITLIIGGPLFGYIFNKARIKYNIKINEPIQFVLGLLCCASGLLLLKLGIVETKVGVLVPFEWLILYAALQALAELLISPITFSMVGSLTPKKMQGTMMGIALLNVGVAAILASHISNIALNASKVSTHASIRLQFSGTMYHLGLAVFAFAIALAFLLPWLNQKAIKSRGQ